MWGAQGLGRGFCFWEWGKWAVGCAHRVLRRSKSVGKSRRREVAGDKRDVSENILLAFPEPPGRVGGIPRVVLAARAAFRWTPPRPIFNGGE